MCVLNACSSDQAVTKSTEKLTESYSYSHPIQFNPPRYHCQQISSAIKIDGILNDTGWKDIPWTTNFVDIEGSLKPKPQFETKSKLAWDSTNLYIAAYLEEKHIWAKLTERDAVIYHDDDFEVFIDPDGDGHNYFEFEMNAFNTVWDLLMLYPYYIDTGKNYMFNWNYEAIETAVHHNGTLNDASDIDSSWTVEIAIPFAAFEDLAKVELPPTEGDIWRLNFSRVDWPVGINGKGEYEKQKDASGKNLSEQNWVWAPTGFVNMHKPETWGYLIFTESELQHSLPKDEKIKWALWQLYYQLKASKESEELCSMSKLKIPQVNIEGYHFDPELDDSQYGFFLSAKALDGRDIVINHKAQIQYH